MLLRPSPSAWLTTFFLLSCGILVLNVRYSLPPPGQGSKSYMFSSDVNCAPKVQSNAMPEINNGTDDLHRYREELTSHYFSNEEMEQFLHAFTSSASCGRISRLFSIGQSVLGANLWVLEISDKPGVQEQEPNFKYVGNMHGNEPGGRQLLMRFALWLCDFYQTDPQATRIVNEMHMFILPTMNPDGYKLRRRENGNMVDLNRNFPDRNRQKQVPMVMTGREEPETTAVMQWSQNMSIVASAAFHEGALVANYPWDASDNGAPGYAAAADDAAFIYLAKVYSSYHQNMAKSQEFPEGITNGNNWYPVYGGMQDWNYINAHCFEITLEVSERKAIPPSELMNHWIENKEALAAYPIAAALGILSGVVKKDGMSGDPLRARIVVEGNEFIVFSESTFGSYYRVLAPGTYTVRAEADGYKSKVARVTVPCELDKGVVQDFYLNEL